MGSVLEEASAKEARGLESAEESGKVVLARELARGWAVAVMDLRAATV